MKLHRLKKTKDKKKKRKGRGYGSGAGAKSGRGTKGQRKRSRVSLGFEGGQLRLYKRLPLLRGKGKNKPISRKPLVLNVENLNLLPQNSKVNIDTLVKYKLVSREQAETYGVKILGDGQLKKSLIVELPVSKGAKKKIEEAGGECKT